MNATSPPANLELVKDRRNQSVCDAGKASEVVEGDEEETPEVRGEGRGSI